MSTLEDYVSVEEAAQVLSVDRSRVTLLCRQGRFDGATKFSGIWMIPRVAILKHEHLPPGPKHKIPRREQDAALLRSALAEARRAKEEA